MKENSSEIPQPTKQHQLDDIHIDPLCLSLNIQRENKQTMRGEVSGIIKELQDACRRSLYDGNFLGDATPIEHPSPTKRQRREKSPQKARNWGKVRFFLQLHLFNAFAVMLTYAPLDFGRCSTFASFHD